MTGTAARRQLERNVVSTDEQLISRCLEGDAEAWSELIDRYKNLIYSIPIRLGMYQDAGDIFQVVCVDLLSKLPQVREHRALPKWLMQTCYHECLRYRRATSREAELDPADAEKPQGTETLQEQTLIQFEEEQTLRDAISEMPARCGHMIHMLFFETPARPYEEIARELGIATGSIGFIRNRCLARLRKHLEKKGFG
jgi:RNA polymerase sigma factor (sigma-70 family)